MRLPYVVIVAALTPAVVLAAPAGKPQTEIAGFTRNAPMPKWVLPLAEIPGTERTDPVVVRLHETQALVGPVPATTINRAIQVNDANALGVIGQYSINYFAQYQKLALHRVVILRGDQRLDRTASVGIQPLQRETGIENGLLGGATTVQLLLDDVRVGDTLWITYTTEGENPVMGKRWSADFHWDSGSPIELRRLTVLHPRDRPLRWRQLGDFQTGQLTPQSEQAGALERIRFEGRALEAVEAEPAMPSEYLPVRMLQFTEYQDWNGVANWADSLFPKAAASPALKALARRFAAEPSAEARAAAALHWVQDEVRYFSVSIGENSHRPQLPDVVLQRRYGDCKDKSYLLVTLLRELGVTAQPLLLSADAPRFAAKVLPTPTWFNHVIVRISIDGRDYYVDPTRVNQPEPLVAMPTAFPGAQVLLVDPAAQGLSTIPERAETLPAFEHIEDIAIADFSGAATLLTRDIYRGTYADWMRVNFTRMSANEQKKNALARYEKLYPGVGLDGAPAYQDLVQDNRVEITSRYRLPKAVVLKNQQYHVAFNSQIIDGTLGVPDKLVRNFPFALAAGLYNGRYRLRIHWPAQVRRYDPAHVKMLDNPYFQLREEFALRGNDVDYLMDYRLKQRSVAAAELPALGEQSKLLNEFVESALRVEQSATSAEAPEYSLRDLNSLRDSGDVLERKELLKNKKEQDIALAEVCGYVNNQHELEEFVGVEAVQLAQRMEALLMSLKPQPGLGACKAQLWFAKGKDAAGVAALAADPLSDDASPLMGELAWAQFHGGDTAAALATMTRHRAAREAAAGGMPNAADVASQIALLQRAGQPLPPALEQFARDIPDGPWPRPVLAMQVGLLSQEQLLQQAESLGGDNKAMALNDAWFYIGQARLVAKDEQGAAQAFHWLNGNGLRNHALTRAARREMRALVERDRHAAAGIKAMLAKDAATAVAAWQAGDAAGSAASRYALGLAALNGGGLPKSPEQALHWFQLAADQGYPDAQAMLGMMHLYGMGTARDADKGMAWMRMAAEQDNLNAQYELGDRYRRGVGVEQDYVQAKQWLSKAADQGQAEAMAALGGMYRDGKGMARNYELAEFWNRRGIMHGSTQAMYGLGTAYEYGEGMERDYAKAAALYRAAADLKHADSAVNLGILYEKGNGVQQDHGQALKWYRQASAQGNHYGTRNLAVMYLYGRGVARDPRQAAEYNRQAIDQGSLDAITGLGIQYHNGNGVPQDYAQARMWYEKAAARRDSLAEYQLGWMYEYGQGVAADTAQAMQWYRRSAEDGDLDAQYRLGQALSYGDGVAQNKVEAVEWYAKSAAQGLAAAQTRLGGIYLYGVGVPSDKPKGVGLLRQAAAQKSTEAYVHLGRAYENGWGVERDVAQAIASYQQASGSLEAQVRLGMLYLGAGQDEARGRRLLAQADEQATASDFAILARTYASVNNKDKAAWAHLRAVELAQRTPGTADADLQEQLDDAVDFLRGTVRYETALPLMLSQLQLAEKRFGAQSVQLANAQEALGDVYQYLGRYADAEAIYLRSLAIKEAVHGARSEEVAAMLNSIAGLFLAADEFDKAAAWSRRALAMHEELNDAALPLGLREMAGIMLVKGEYAEAEQLQLRALALQEKKVGQDAAALAGPLNTLGVIYYKRQIYDKANQTLERAIRLVESQGAGTAFSLAVYKTSLANLRIEQKKYAEAEKLIQEAQASKTLVVGDNHPELSYGLYSLGLLYKSQQQYDKAQESLLRALALREGAPGYNGRDAAEVLQELGEVYRLQGMDEQAERVLLRALTIRSRIMEERHPELKATRASLAALHSKPGAN